MAEINLPDMSLLWASAGDILKPSDSKIQQGWAPEVPPRQWFNWLDNRQDQAIGHIAQHGIVEWIPTFEYQGDKSYVQGPTNGLIYRCKVTHVGQNPETDLSNTYWEVAFTVAGETYTKAEVDSKTTIASTSQAQTQTSNTTLISPLRLSEAFKGGNQTLLVNGEQKFPGGLKICWGSATTNASGGAVFTYPSPFTNAVLLPVVCPTKNSGGITSLSAAVETSPGALTLTSCTAWANTASAGIVIYFIVIGY